MDNSNLFQPAQVQGLVKVLQANPQIASHLQQNPALVQQIEANPTLLQHLITQGVPAQPQQAIPQQGQQANPQPQNQVPNPNAQVASPDSNQAPPQDHDLEIAKAMKYFLETKSGQKVLAELKHHFPSVFKKEHK